MIKIMLDSASDSKNSSLYDYFIPMAVNIDGKEYRDGVDLDNTLFYKLLSTCSDFPRTSQPSPDDFIKIFEQVKKKGEELIYFSISSKLSGTYQSANIAKEIVDYEGIYIVDSCNASHMIGILAFYAKALIKEGVSADNIVRKCETIKGKIRVFAGVDTLEYLKKGGRIGKASAMIGSLANIKPLITVTKDGEVDSFGKALGFGKAVMAVCEKVKGFDIDYGFPVYSLYTFGEENCIKLEERLKASGIKTTDRLQIGSTIGTHVGPGVYGVCFVEK